MIVICVIIVVTSCFNLSVQSAINVSDENYHLLPPIFHIEAGEKCSREKKLFCTINLKITPLNIHEPSQIWKLMEQTTTSKEFYRHDELFHVMCLNGNHYDTRGTINTTFLKHNILELYNKKYKNKGLNVTILDVNCEQFKYSVSLFDIILLISLVSYILLLIIATFHDIMNHGNVKKIKLIKVFSLRHNLVKLQEKYRKTYFENLRCIQGIRFYTTIFIIFCHTFCSFAGGYIENTKYFEDIHRNFIRHSLRILFVFLVQTFFLLSGWLLSYHTFKIFKNTAQINVCKYALLTFCNRYIRIVPPVLVMVSLDTSVWIYRFFYGPVKSVYSDKEFQRCQKNWWIHFLFLSNHYRHQDMCYFTLWYLSADTQLYAFSIICLILIQKFKQIKFYIMTICFVIGITIPSIISYVYNLEVIYKITPENSKNNMFLTYFEFSTSYTSTYANMATYMLGLIFGYIYFRFEHKIMFDSKFSNILWWILVVGSPLAVIIIPSFEYGRLTSAILAGILKPLYAFGIGVAILGMSEKHGGLLRLVCEWKPAVFLGNCTYSTYVVHFGIVFYRTATAVTPLQVSDAILLKAFIQDTILSFFCGFLLYLIIEMPMSQLQQALVPKYSLDNLVEFNSKSE